MSDSIPDTPPLAAVRRLLRRPDAARQEPLRFPFLFVLFLLLTIGIGSFLIYEKQSQTETEIIRQNLAAVSTLKASQIHQWISRSKANVRNRARHSALASQSAEWIGKGMHQDGDAQSIRDRLNAAAKRYGIAELVLLDLSGKPLIGTVPETAGTAPDPELVRRAGKKRKTLLGTIRWDRLPDGKRTAMLDIVSPVIPRSENTAIGVLLARYDADAQLFPLVESWPAESGTAETVLFVPENGDAAILNRLRFQPEA